ncbi:DUF1080 domain-containing protein [Candidatus Latescibacterota bacterium]
MKRAFSVCFLFIFITGALFTTNASAQDFVPLFNGKNLDGWVNVNCAPETWTARDNMIVCSGVPYGVLRTDKQYENYILEFEWKHIEKGGNAGLFIHAAALPGSNWPFPPSFEVQVQDGNPGDVFPISGPKMTPSKPSQGGRVMSRPTEDRQKPAGEWNHYRVESRDGTVKVAINGEFVTTAYHLNPRKGYICLESEGSEIHFRDIKISELPSTNPPPDVIAKEDEGFRSLYNGVDLRGWKQVPGNVGHWTSKGWILSYDGQSTAPTDDKHLTTEEEFVDFVLIADWRLPAEPVIEAVPVILPDGSVLKDAEGENVNVEVMDAGDSGIYLRGSEKAQVNIWNWPVGSGEFYGYRTDQSMSAEVRKGATPFLNADNPVGDWNRFEITVIGESVTIILNGKTVIREAHLPGIPAKGPIKLQHHGEGVEFSNIFIKELD